MLIRFVCTLPLLLTLIAGCSGDTQPEDIGKAAVELTREPTKEATEAIQRYVLGGLSTGNGPLAEGSQRQLENMRRAEAEKNRANRRTMQECIKPGNLIDQDVQECLNGLREPTWSNP